MSQTINKRLVVPFGSRKRETWFCTSNTNGESVTIDTTLLADPKYVMYEVAGKMKTTTGNVFGATTVSLSGRTVSIASSPAPATIYVVHIWGF